MLFASPHPSHFHYFSISRVQPTIRRKQEPDHHEQQSHSPHGGYRELKSFHHAELVYDATVKFCDRFLDLRSRTHDQMVQAARSGPSEHGRRQSSFRRFGKIELKLVSVARASFEELLLDYEDFLRQRGLANVGKGSPHRSNGRRLAYEKNSSYMTYSLVESSLALTISILVRYSLSSAPTFPSR